MSAGKGDKPRPIIKKIFDANYDKINWNQTNSNKANTVEKKTFKHKTIYKYK